MPQTPALALIDYWRSGTSHRLRIALELKGLRYARSHVDLGAGAQHAADFMAVNPQGLAPVLIVDGTPLTQTPAILEWLEETVPVPALLPPDPAARAHVRALAAVVACDIHPLGNVRVLNYLRNELGQDDAAVAGFARRWTVDGFAALERLLANAPPGPWAWGEAPTLADCCIVPQLYAAVDRYGVALSGRLAAIAAAAEGHPAFIAAHPLSQPDAPKPK
ncbi:MAG: maleylacetoacetate isomerase [Alphaproteobacteria bacterium]|nr:maleylacetoacetate isomerase [Alphaproteobacteria bacterium]